MRGLFKFVLVDLYAHNPTDGITVTLLKVLANPAYRFKRIGLEAGPLSQLLLGWLLASVITARWSRSRQ
jgi:hypothetical protein